MRIDRVQLRNFRCFEDQSFRFADDFTLLIGANATGKSSVLDALAIAAGSALMGVSDATARLIRRLDVRRSYPTGAEVGSFDEHYPAVVAAWGRIDGADLSWRRELRSPKSRTTYREANAVRAAMDELAHRSRGGAEVLFPCIAYYSTGRLWLEQREPKSGGMDPGRQDLPLRRLPELPDAQIQHPAVGSANQAAVPHSRRNGANGWKRWPRSLPPSPIAWRVRQAPASTLRRTTSPSSLKAVSVVLSGC